MFSQRVNGSWLIVLLASSFATAQEPTSRVVAYHAYTEAVELRQGDVRAVVCPQAGGRVLEFSVAGQNALYFDEQEKQWSPSRPGPISAGRFDFGPELTVPPHPTLWSGSWTAEITGPGAVQLTSAVDPSAGVQLTRSFELRATKDDRSKLAPCLSCRQTITNRGEQTIDVCHWGRSFSPGGGICLIPLGDRPSRFPSRYAMYEDSAIINVRDSDPLIRRRDGFLEILAPPRKPKLGFDTYAGWLAYLMPSGRMLVKRFPTDPDRVYNEAAGLTLSVWYPQGPRIELEPIGPRERLAPGASASFVEDWWLLEHPFPAAGAMIDLQRVRGQVAEQTEAPRP